jgi:hypothetical protein
MEIQEVTKAVCLAAAMGTGFMLSAGANTIDLLSAGASGTISGNGNTSVAWFQQISPQPTGTGVIDPFLRVQHNSEEHGFNTDVRPNGMDQDNTAQWNHSLLLSAVPIVVNPAGAPADSYYQFLLDINESSGNGGGDQQFLALDTLRLYVITGNPNSGASTVAALETATGAPDWSFDADDRIKMDYSLNSGSGSGDMFAYIPVSALGAGGANIYLTLYSHFGALGTGADALPSGYDSSDGFEEWAVLKAKATPPVPEPHEYAMLGLGFLGLFAGWSRVRKTRTA